jgi:hypothetical protein
MEKKYKIDTSAGKAIEIIANINGMTVSNEYTIIKDFKGMKIFVNNKVVYLTAENSEVIK